jgi:anti-anti-sigma factor
MQTTLRVLLQHAEYDFSSSDRLDVELSVLHSGAAVVDFSNVTFLDSSALTRLIGTLKRMQATDANSSMALVNLRPPIRRLFELTSLDRLFSIA